MPYPGDKKEESTVDRRGGVNQPLSCCSDNKRPIFQNKQTCFIDKIDLLWYNTINQKPVEREGKSV